MAEIAFRNVTKRYGQTVAVDDASFTIADNEFFCFFGPPLSGKTTILRLILGLETPDDGEILIGGQPVNAMSPRPQRNVAMVFQNLALFPHMTAERECPLSAGRTQRRPKPTSHARSPMSPPNCTSAISCTNTPAQLSGGERQRVAIARALGARSSRLSDGRSDFGARRPPARRNPRGAEAHPARGGADADLCHP